MTKKRLFEIGTPHAIALGAGIASALLFCLAGRGTLAAMMLAYLSPLPLMIAALGFNLGTGLVATLTGTLCVTALIGMATLTPGDLPDTSELPRQTLANAAQTGVIYLISLGLPSFCLAFLGRLEQQPSQQSQTETSSFLRSIFTGRRAANQPFSRQQLSRIFTFALLVSCLLVTGGSLWIWARQGGFEAVLRKTTAEILPLLTQLDTTSLKWPAGIEPADIARMIVLAVGPAMAASTLLMLLVNLWLAGRVAQISGRLSQDWPDIPHNLRLPWIFVPLFILACAVSFLGGPAGFIGLIFSVTIGLGFALQGLAAIHDLTRGTSYRLPLLIIVYLAFLVLTPWPLTLFGLADAIFPFGKRRDVALAESESSLKTHP